MNHPSHRRPPRLSVSRPRVLYIASAGIDDPLIVSQVLRYLKRLAESCDACHLMTLERNDRTTEATVTHRQQLAQCGIVWHPLPATSGLRMLNTPREIRAGRGAAIRLIRDHDLNIVHARSFIPGNIALTAARKTGAAFLYDMRGFWADEKAAKGTIRQAWLKSLAQRMEDRLFHAADRLISLTNAGERSLRDRGVQTPIDVIPCCVDTSLFAWDGRARNKPRHFICTGSLGPGYLPEAVFGIVAAAKRRWPDTHLTLLTATDRSQLQDLALAAGLTSTDLSIDRVPPQQVPERLAAADVGLCLIEPSRAKIASSPTKLAEYLACGLPVVANGHGIGDLAEILHGGTVGVNVSSLDAMGFERAIDDLDRLFQSRSETLSGDCRALAVREFDLSIGVQRYQRAYQQLMSTWESPKGANQVSRNA